jgi:hypothetical protein
VFPYRIGATFAAVALSVLAACSDSTAPNPDPCHDYEVAEAHGYGNPRSTSTGTNPDGSHFETWFFGTGTSSDPFHSTRFTWGGPVSGCKVERFST